MRKQAYILLLLSAMSVALFAQETTPIGYQIADNTFFDPTRKQQVEEDYHFGMEYRIEAGFTQHQQRSEKITYPDMYMHGPRIGATFTFLLPRHFSLQTGLLYTLVYGRNDQHWRSVTAPESQEEYIRHRVLEHSLTVPVRAFYTIPLWRQLNLLFYGGAQLHIGLAENDYMKTYLSDGNRLWLESQGIYTEPYDRMAVGEKGRANIQLGVGAGLEWDRYRLQGGYDFGLNNLVNHRLTTGQHMWEWGWYVSFSYRL